MSKKRKKNKGQETTRPSKSPQPLEISMEETEELLKKIEEKKLEDKDFERIKAFIRSFVFIRKLLERQKLSMNKLRNLFFGKKKTEKSKNILSEIPQIPETETESSQSGGKENKEEIEIEIEIESSNNDNDNDNNKISKKRKGHGRNGASAYVGAEEIYIPHEKLKAGQSCPDCENANLYKWNIDGIEIRIKGSAPLEAKVYKLEKLRCALCGKLYTAQLPPEAGKDKYDAQAGAIISLLKYGSGFPFYRLDNFQKALGVPVPASTQWEIVCSVFKTVIHLYEEMVRQAAQGELFYTDDTGVGILSIMKENKEKEKEKKKKKKAMAVVDSEEGAAPWEKRKATYTSGIMSKVGDHFIVLYFSGRKYAGENLDELLKKRASHLGPPLQMSDALSRNYPKEFATIVINCLCHGRRKFVELIESYPQECRFVIEILAEVYKYDEEAREKRMTPWERLCFHQEKSQPLMDKLEKWFADQFSQKKVEPNSNLGQTIKYMQNHWKELTGFLRIEGAPLDNNCLERALKVAILNRKNAYFYKTKNSAHVGDVFMSMIETCRRAKANPLEYLTVIQENAIDVLNNPDKWLPWNYTENKPSMK